MNRRSFVAQSAAALALRSSFSANKARSESASQTADHGKSEKDGALSLHSYQPRSMLHLEEMHIPRARFPVIDIHTHVTEEGRTNHPLFMMEPEACLQVMNRKNVQIMVNLTAGYGDGLHQVIDKVQRESPGRILVFTEPAWDKASDPGYSRTQAELIEDAYQHGAKGVKILKTLGLYLREHKTNQLIRIDDPRFDAIWQTAGDLNIPVLIHSSDPEAFFLPIDRFNERWEELHAHPDWSFYGQDFPQDRDLQEARRNVMRRHPRTQFICAHVADAENLQYVSECLDSHPNMHVDIAARIGELGRQPRVARKFFDKYQDRILFGTDASADPNTPQQTFVDALYEIYFRFLETNDEYFDYAPSPTPPQGRWRIYGLGLPESILRKVYWENAAHLLQISAMPESTKA